MQEHVVCTTVKTFDDTQFLRTHRARRAQCRVVRHARGLLPASASAPYLLYAASSRHLRCACFYLHYAVSTCITQRSTCTEQRLPASHSVLLPALRSVYQTYAAPTFCHLRCVCSSLHYAVYYLCCPCLPVYAAFYLHCAASATPGALFLPQPCVCVPSIRYAPFATRLAALLPLGCACLSLHMECCYIRPCLLMQRCGL